MVEGLASSTPDSLSLEIAIWEVRLKGRLRQQSRTSFHSVSVATRTIAAGLVVATVAIVALGLFVAVQPSQRDRTAPANANSTTTTVSLTSAAETYTKYAAPFGRALEQWNTRWSEFKQTTSQSGVVPTDAQVSAVETPVIDAANRFIMKLEQMTVPGNIRADLHNEIGDLSAFVGDEKEVNALWPASESVTLRGEADVARLNAAASVFAADLHVTLTTTP
jgi:hypothetical protein